MYIEVNKNIPIVARLQIDKRVRLPDLNSVYIYGSTNYAKVSVPDAGRARLRPVLITVGATILALFPLAIHGVSLWQPLCYAQTAVLPSPQS